MQCGFVPFTEAQATVQVNERRDAEVLRAMDPDPASAESVHHAEELLQVPGLGLFPRHGDLHEGHALPRDGLGFAGQRIRRGRQGKVDDRFDAEFRQAPDVADESWPDVHKPSNTGRVFGASNS